MLSRKALIALVIAAILTLTLTGLAVASVLHRHTVTINVNDMIGEVTPSSIEAYRNMTVTETFTIYTTENITLDIGTEGTIPGVTVTVSPMTINATPSGTTFDVTVVASATAESGQIDLTFSEHVT